MKSSEYAVEDLPANMQSKIRLVPSPAMGTECWEWTKATNSKGYGCVGIDGRSQLTHRVAYALLKEAIPDRKQLDHLCRNIVCCNPGHLDPVTNKVNQERRPSANKSHCKHGHEMTEENTMVKKRANGLVQKNCRECERVAQRRRRQAVAA